MTATERGAIAALAGLALAACAEGGPSRSALLDVGDSVPPSLELSNDRSALVWTLNSVDCLTCKLAEASWVARRLQHRSPHRLETVVVAVGESSGRNREIVAGFLASERIEAAIQMLTPRQHAGVFGRSAPLPALYAVGRDGSVLATVPDPAAPGVPDWESFDLDEVLQRLARSFERDEQLDTSNPTRKENQR